MKAKTEPTNNHKSKQHESSSRPWDSSASYSFERDAEKHDTTMHFEHEHSCVVATTLAML